MISRTAQKHPAPRPGHAAALLCVALMVVFSAGCSSVQRHLLHFYKRESRPGHTRLAEPVTTIPARIEANYFIVEAKWDKHGPWRFIVDTGSSVTLLSPDYVKRYPAEKKDGASARSINVRTASGRVQKLPPANVRIIKLGDAMFSNVPVLIYDCAELSAHFGMRIDGIIGFPLFRDTVFSLDYPQSRLIISRRSAVRSVPGVTVKFNNEIRAPIIPVSVGGETFSALIDSGSDGALVLNPLGLSPEFSQPPRTGATIGTILGDRVQEIGRLSTPLRIGECKVEQPIVDITDQLSAIGGEILKNYCLVFDSKLGTVTFQRSTDAPLEMGSQRSAGLSFAKTPAYWRVLSVVPGSPAEDAGVQAGDIVARINGEHVSAWQLQRYDKLVRESGEITYTFVRGQREEPMVIPVFDLVK
ncbi:hypothetical protein M2103_002086 [Ereboglobus sp. PH5-5]|uniref:aspartyl protease family protein n=1 Tax=Ereboglobus sp. PH5-5 TaxID=2940529 RepID=UPI002404C98F|nr:aspartyl protease family protein [Ereboglobus sp. PH5-5]MDF9833853.1 hypothetical protein [Ereboglobus sp. PH5-5]